jgi:hypothetical protein
MIQIIVLIIIISLLDSFYLFFLQKYGKFLYNNIEFSNSFISVIYAYLVWFLIACAIYFLIISRPDYTFTTILKTAPILGIVLFGINGFSQMIISPEKSSFMIIGIDIIRGIILVTLSTFIISLYRKFFKNQK